MTIGEVIRDYCARHGLSFREFAIRCDISNGYISNLANGTPSRSSGKPLKVSPKTLSKLANGMNMTLDDLLNTLDSDSIIPQQTAEEAIPAEYEDKYNAAFALMGEVRDLSSEEINDVLNFVKFVKSKRN